MLARLFGNLFAGRRALEPAVATQLEHEKRGKWANAHARSPMRRHLEITMGDLRLGDHDLRTLTDSCQAASDTRLHPLKALRRPLAFYFLARYFLQAMELEGAFAECGVFRGTSALLLCRAAQTRRPGYAGDGLHLIDSFEGISAPTDEDWFDDRAADGSVVKSNMPAGSYATSIDYVKKTLSDFPQVSIHHGWIPDAFAKLPTTSWAFVHIDVDLYEPTLRCLEYFAPRLCDGGVIVCDDYVAPLFPGAQRAWDRYCERHNLPFVVLDTGQSVILKA